MESLALVVAVVAFIATMLNLIITLAVVRRLAEDADARSIVGIPPGTSRLDDGTRLPQLRGVVDGGGDWDGSLFRGPAVVSILSGSCSACEGSARELRSLLEESPTAPELVVLYGDPAEDTEHLDSILGGLPTTVRFDRASLHESYAVGATPFHYAIDANGEIISAALVPAEVVSAVGVTAR